MTTVSSLNAIRPVAATLRQAALVDYLRRVLLTPRDRCERFHAIFIDAARAYLGDGPLGHGTPGSLTVRMRDVFSQALSLGASAIILAHNHPSGNCRPSAQDILATRKFGEIANALDIALLDHLILTDTSVYSMRAGGLL